MEKRTGTGFPYAKLSEIPRGLAFARILGMTKRPVCPERSRVVNARRFVCATGLLALLAGVARAQYQPIPNFSGTLAGQQFRQALNNKLNGSDTIAPQLVHLTVSQLPAVTNGQMYYVTDAVPGTPCTTGGTGAFASGKGGVWSCGPLPGGTSAPTSVSCSHQANVVGSGVFNAGATNNSGSFTTPQSSTDSDNCTVTFSVPSPAARMCNWSVTNQDGSASVAGVADVTTTTTAKVDFASAGSNVNGGVLTIGYSCF